MTRWSIRINILAIPTSHAFSPKDDALGLIEMFNFTIAVSNVKRNNIISTTITGCPFLREKKNWAYRCQVPADRSWPNEQVMLTSKRVFLHLIFEKTCLQIIFHIQHYWQREISIEAGETDNFPTKCKLHIIIYFLGLLDRWKRNNMLCALKKLVANMCRLDQYTNTTATWKVENLQHDFHRDENKDRCDFAAHMNSWIHDKEKRKKKLLDLGTERLGRKFF